MHEFETGNFDIYLEKYCKERGISKEEALKHKIVQEVKAYYEIEKESRTRK